MLKTAVYLAAGWGERLGIYAEERPKAFIEIGGRSLFERSVEILVKNGVEKIIIGTGFRSDCFEAFAAEHQELSISCVRNEDYLSSGTMHTLYTLREHISSPFLLLEADLLFENRAISVMQSEMRDNVILASGTTNQGDEVFIQVDSQNRMEKVSKKRSEIENSVGELTGISKVSLEAYKAICNFHEQEASIMFSKSYEDAFPFIKEDNPFYILTIEDLVWCEIDCLEQMNLARQNTFPALLELERARFDGAFTHT